MLEWILKFFIGTQNERALKKLNPFPGQINSLEPEVSKLSDESLRAKTDEFKKRFSNGETLDDILIDAFAVVREAAKRTIGLRPFDVQLIGGIALHQGKIAEMKTGEGKTLVATLAVYLNALSGKGVHVVTVNDYLAKRDRQWMGPVYESLGLTVGFIQHGMEKEERKNAYACDVTYVTNNEIGFDYLKDNLVKDKEDRVLRTFNYAIIDEVDSILIDEARTPLIISGPGQQSSQRYYVANRLVPQLKGRFITETEEIEAKQKNITLGAGYDYIIDEKANTATLTDQGITKCERLLGVKSIYDDISGEWLHHISQALRAHNLYHRDVEYVIKDGEVVIVDEFTGRLMPGRRWSEGLHQAVEAKEGLRIAEESQTLATVTFQNFFRLYKKLAGMTGTAATEAAEFWEIYKLDVIVIPTNKPLIRKDHADRIFRTEKEKNEAIINEIEELWKKGQPVLVGTRSIEKNEKISGMLRRKGIPHQVLNAKHHESEASIIAQAGRKGTVTIATNMAGRGTDIVLGGNPQIAEEAEFVKNNGGLHVLGSERHDARRIDNQLRGRTGRQGDPGSSRFYLALDDELMRLFGSDRISGIMQKLGMQEGEDIQHPWINKAIENAQRKVEGMNFDIRKQLLEFDNVISKQREAIYALRNAILDGSDISTRIQTMLTESLQEKLDSWAPPKVHPEMWNLPSLRAWLHRSFALELKNKPEEMRDRRELEESVEKELFDAYKLRESSVGQDIMRNLEHMVLLQVMDTAWVEHLTYLEQLRKGIFLRAYGQKDPLIEFQKEGFRLFEDMMQRIREETIEYIFKVHVVPETVRRQPVVMTAEKPEFTGHQPKGAQPQRQQPHKKGQGPQPKTQTITVKKVGRNDPCPCGSGKKYKKCCGR